MKLAKEEKPVKKISESSSERAYNKKEILSALWEKESEPLNAVKIDCHRVFDSNFRVNVWSGERICNSVKITKSYFVKLGQGYNILEIKKN
jgi:hypothetical protein